MAPPWFALLLHLPPVSIGITGGLPVTDFIRDTRAGSRGGFGQVESAPRRYTIGPSVEWRGRRGLSLEAGVLYKRFGFDTMTAGGSFNLPRVTTQSQTRGNAWEMPVLARSRLTLRRNVYLTLGGGMGLRFLSGVRESGLRTVSAFFNEPGRVEVTAFTSRQPDRSPMLGAVADLGVELPVTGGWRWSPRVRFTQWDSERTTRGDPSPVRFARFQTELLLSMNWLPKAGRAPEAWPFPKRLEMGVLFDAGGGTGALWDWRVQPIVLD